VDRIEGKGVSVIEDEGGGVDAISSEDKGTGDGINCTGGEVGRLNDVDAGSVRSSSRSPGTSN
jgi:hypothetical protein